ncbi:GNAT family N-acetyltransferase [Yinghuangia aomiensis]|uniref:GNAT family N-acetyltransferase n=1 Tax=Yinghuangia aomiensis TaxID=676205 RepID=A0ABP9H8M4_9ACTN
MSVRRRLSPEGAPPQFGDVVGVLDAWSAGVLTITRKDGSITRVDEHTLVAGKVVPPVPARGPAALPVELLQAAADRAWPAFEYAALGGWRLRAAGGFTARANSVLALDEPGLPFDAALAEAERWYADRGLPCLFQTVDGDAEDRALAALGWTPVRAALFRTGRLAAARDRLDAVDDSRVELSGTFDDAWMSLYRRVDDLSPEVRHVLAGPPGTLFAQIRDAATGATVAIGRCAIEVGGDAGPGPGRRLAGFAAVEVDPAHRRQGLARAIMKALTAEALDAGATTGWLQVEPDNDPAIALYDALGFADHHRYHYRQPPQA